MLLLLLLLLGCVSIATTHGRHHTMQLAEQRLS
jgi:hypothetical protein